MTQQITAWTGGSAPDPIVTRARNSRGREFRRIRRELFREQVTIWREYWGDSPDHHTIRIFWNRAQHDAWSTVRTETE